MSEQTVRNQLVNAVSKMQMRALRHLLREREARKRERAPWRGTRAATLDALRRGGLIEHRAGDHALTKFGVGAARGRSLDLRSLVVVYDVMES